MGTIVMLDPQSNTSVNVAQPTDALCDGRRVSRLLMGTHAPPFQVLPVSAAPHLACDI